MSDSSGQKAVTSQVARAGSLSVPGFGADRSNQTPTMPI